MALQSTWWIELDDIADSGPILVEPVHLFGVVYQSFSSFDRYPAPFVGAVYETGNSLLIMVKPAQKNQTDIMSAIAPNATTMPALPRVMFSSFLFPACATVQPPPYPNSLPCQTAKTIKLPPKSSQASNSHLIQNLQDPTPTSTAILLAQALSHSLPLSIQIPHQDPRPLRQRRQHLPTILKTSRALHIRHGIPLHLLIIRLLLQNIQEHHILRLGADAVDDGEGEFALSEILAEAFVLRVFWRREILVVVADLEDYADEVDEGYAVSVVGEMLLACNSWGRMRIGGENVLQTFALCLHELHCQSEKTSCLIPHHLEIIILARACQCIPPEQIHALSSMQIQQFLRVDGDRLGVLQLLQLLQSNKVDIIRRVDRLCRSEDAVGNRKSSAQ